MGYSSHMEQNAPIIEDDPLDPRALRQFRAATRARLAAHRQMQGAVAVLLCVVGSGVVYMGDHRLLIDVLVGLVLGIGLANPVTLLLLRIQSR